MKVGLPAAPAARDTAPRSLAWLEASELWPRRDTPGARNELVQRFLPLARRLAFRYRNPNEPFEDLVQVASVGLLGAIDRFDPDRGIAFPAFAIPTILGELKRHFRQTGWAVHVPRGAQEMALRVDQATRELAGRTSGVPRVDVLAEHLHASIEDVLLGLDAWAAHYSTSLDAPAPGTDSDDDQTVGDRLGTEDEGIGLVEASLSLSAAIAHLPYLERRALVMRIEQNMTQAEIGQHLGCSQMQISRLLRRATTRLHSLTDPQLPLDTGVARQPRCAGPDGTATRATRG
jgi:RNA polymerase sigma-B factor